MCEYCEIFNFHFKKSNVMIYCMQSGNEISFIASSIFALHIKLPSQVSLHLLCFFDII